MTTMRSLKIIVGLAFFCLVFSVTANEDQLKVDKNENEAVVGMNGELVAEVESTSYSMESDTTVVENSVVAGDGVGDPNCPNRSDIVKCAGKYLDLDQDGYLSRKELDIAINNLPWYGRGILQLLGSTDKMMQKCDIDKDDYISIDHDMVHNGETCLKTCFKRRAFRSSFFPNCNL